MSWVELIKAENILLQLVLAICKKPAHHFSSEDEANIREASVKVEQERSKLGV